MFTAIFFGMLMMGASGQAMPRIDVEMAAPAITPPAAKLQYSKPAPIKPGPDLSNITPHCICQAQCEAMLADATDAIESASRMRIRLASETMLDTYVPTRIGYLHGRVLKRPDGTGGYLFEARFDADPPLPAAEKSALRLFNLSLQSPTTMRMCTPT